MERAVFLLIWQMCFKGRLKGLLFAFFGTFLLFTPLPLNADEFIFWAKLGNENLILNHQSIYISSAMSPKNSTLSGINDNKNAIKSSENLGEKGEDKNLNKKGENLGENTEKNLIFVCELAYTENDFKTLPKSTLGLVDDEMPKKAKLDFLNAHKDELLDCFFGENVEVKDFYKEEFAPNALTIANQTKAIKENSTKTIKNQTQIKILPTRFTINFATQKAIIYKIP